MADPFSIIAGTISLADVCFRFGVSLKEIKDGSEKVDEDLEALSQDLAALETVNELIRRSFETDLAATVENPDYSTTANLWKAANHNLKDCQDILQKLNGLVTMIVGIGSSNKALAKLDSLRKYLKKQSKEEEFAHLQQKLSIHQAALQMILTGVNIAYTRRSQSTSNESFAQLSETIQDLGSDLRSKIAAVQARIGSYSESSFAVALTSAKAVLPLASLNEYFSIPQAVSSIFTGRAADLDTLKRSILTPLPSDQLHSQKRFVIYGLGGSGKTQFCCKFAQENRHYFWGVFWVDANSDESAKQSFSRIARMGKVEPNDRAAKSWLSCQDRPWLLIIDNADNVNIPVENYFPEGEGGIILITTRNPNLRVHGTIGPRCYQFSELAETESNDLLLKAADEPTPWSFSTQKCATDICKTLGFLPLALVHAGRTILARLCTLQNYLKYFETNWNRIRKTRGRHKRVVSDSNAIIYSSYDILYYGLAAMGTQASEDALDLLKIFSFLHRQRIRVDILLHAVSNPKLESQEQARKELEEQRAGRKPVPRSFAQTVKSLGLDIVIFFLRMGMRPVLPRVLRDDAESGSFDEFRLREALRELHQMSLIFFSPEDDSYSMHPVVHLWVRERPEMSIAEQAVWCQAAATILSQSILFPPLDEKEEVETFQRDLLPHVDHVLQCEDGIRAKLLENQTTRVRPWPVLHAGLGPQQAIQLAKFSLIYAKSGLWHEAERLQLQVADFATQMLGMEHPLTMDIKLFLSGTYWQLGKGDQAANLQQEVLEACVKSRGADDLKTLKVMDTLGVSRWQQARFQEAVVLHERAIEGLKRVHGNDHPDTLRAQGNLGRVIAKNFQFTEAVEMHQKVVSGLIKEESLGPTHLDTLIAMDNLAMAYFDRAAHGYGLPGDLDHAHRLESEVVERRKAKLGKEHPYTLWAACNLARIKALRGDIEEALSIMHAGIPVAERNLGETHIGTLFGKLHLGRILLIGKRYGEAEEVLLNVVKAHEGPRTGHPDRLLAMFSLIKSRNLQGKRTEIEPLREELLKGTRALFGENHAWEKYLLDPTNLSDETP